MVIKRDIHTVINVALTVLYIQGKRTTRSNITKMATKHNRKELWLLMEQKTDPCTKTTD